ncbi:BlaR1 family beta-lactam sensor/signal transducer [Vallitalea okinawensis]|uniref:BlaR1 family beta-lactam sensor/signal transducer n=1 Tax=Vallitalea okinawensis TaxID=2078660 RepID=UPI000CFD00CB|nr:BlaR1 family beta-lactam sensor/signal transducer [Vallitalea okinawensis]
MGSPEFFSWLFYSSLMGSVLTIIILLIRFISNDRLGAKWYYYIWMLLLIRLMLPIGLESKLNQILPSAGYQEKTFEQLVKSNEVLDLITMPRDYALSIDENSLEFISQPLFALWAVGAILFILHAICLNLKNWRLLKEKERVDDPSIIRILINCQDRLHIKRDISLLTTSQVHSPALVGIFKPYLLIPKDILNSLSTEQLQHVLLHELIHYKRKDLIVNWVISCLQVLHWFNPIIWHGFRQMRLDRETACDAVVLSYLKPEKYKDYGATIINLLESTSNTHYFSSVASFLNTKKEMKKRIIMIATFKRVKVRTTLIRSSLFILLGCFTLLTCRGMELPKKALKVSDLSGEVFEEDLEVYFDGYDGSFIMLNLGKDQYHIYNEEKSVTRISPYSTYKYLIALMGLEAGVLRENDTLLGWDGTVYPFNEWNNDHTLASAMTYSVNWYFEEAASRVGKEKITLYMDKIDYGNNDISGGIRDYWNYSSLTISPLEQVEVLKEFYTYKIPFTKHNIDAVKEVLKISEQKGYSLSGKTGTLMMNNQETCGWFIGYVEMDDATYIFATNIEGNNDAGGSKAREITLAILRDKML